MSEINPWGEVENDVETDGVFGADGVIDLTGESEDRREQAEDVESTPFSTTAKKKRSILPILIVVAIAGLGAAAYVGYGLYQKLFGSEEVSRSGGGSLIDTSLSAESRHSLPGAEVTATANSLPISSSQASSLPINSSGTSEDPGDEDLAPFVSVTGSSPEVKAGVPTVNSEGAAVAVSPPPASVATVAKTPAAPITVAPAEIKTAIVPSSSPAVVVEKNSPIVTATPAVRAPELKAPVPKKASSRTRVVQRPNGVLARTGREKPRAHAVVAQRSSKDLGRMSNYIILAIEPKHGSFQQAWVRDAKGKVSVIAKGDLIDGARVTDVQFDLWRVMTDRGEMRK